MSEQHSPAAVPLQPECVQGITEYTNIGHINTILEYDLRMAFGHRCCRCERVFICITTNSPFSVFGLQQAQVGLPLVTDDLATGEASDRDNHVAMFGVVGVSAQIFISQ